VVSNTFSAGTVKVGGDGAAGAGVPSGIEPMIWGVAETADSSARTRVEAANMARNAREGDFMKKEGRSFLVDGE
jgi:hypothetical protein